MERIMEKMHEARLQRNSLNNNTQTKSSEILEYLPSGRKLYWLAGGVLLGAIVISIVWFVAAVDKANRHKVMDRLQEEHHEHSGLTQSASIEAMRENLTILSEQVQTLTTSVADLKNMVLKRSAKTNSAASLNSPIEQSELQQHAEISAPGAVLETLPGPAAGMAEVETLGSTDAGMTERIINSTKSSGTEHASVDNKLQKRETDTGSWTINIASLPQKEKAEHFVEKARTKGINAGLYQVTVKGQQYWRVNVSGFNTSTEAKSQASLIKERLGLKDVWVSKR